MNKSKPTTLNKQNRKVYTLLSYMLKCQATFAVKNNIVYAVSKDKKGLQVKYEITVPCIKTGLLGFFHTEP